jgi:hypothetical protein
MSIAQCGDVVAQCGDVYSSVRGCGSSVRGCGSSVGDVIAQWGMWLLSAGCGSSVRDAVAQWLSPLADTRLQRSSSGFDTGFLHSLLRGGRIYDFVTQNKISGCES